VAGELGLSFDGGDFGRLEAHQDRALGHWYTLMLTPLHHEQLFKSCCTAVPMRLASPPAARFISAARFSSDDALTACRRTITNEFSGQQRYALVGALLAAMLGLELPLWCSMSSAGAPIATTPKKLPNS